VRPTPLLALIGALSATVPSMAAPAADAAKRSIAYSIANWGAEGVDMRRFARVVDATLNDPRGWSLGGTVRFTRGPAASFQVTIAAPSVVGSFAGCSAYYSCRSGHYVLINADRWAHATPAFPGERLRHVYRQMVVNHEVGHALGFGHAGCSGPGDPAPVMQQQSKGLQGCRASAWPSSRERSTLAGWLGVPARAVPPSLALGRRAMWIALGATRRSVTARLGLPARRRRAGAVVQERYWLPPLTIAYRKGRVQAITTRSREDLTASGVGVGVTVKRLRARLHGELCVPQSGAVRSCAVERRGDRLTTFLVRDGRVSAVRVERLPGGHRPGEGRSGSAAAALPAVRREMARQDVDDLSDGDIEWHVLPEPKHLPSFSHKDARHATIPFAISRELGDPVLGIGLGHSAVIRASMPEAAVDEHGDPRARKHEIWPDAKLAGDDRKIPSVTVAAAMQCGSQAPLRSGVTTAIAFSRGGSRGTRRVRIRVLHLRRCMAPRSAHHRSG
jgi:hypothetical protein